MNGLRRSIWVLTGLVVGVACLWVWGPASLQAGAITVCPVGCDYNTVQGAVNAAAPLSTILISPATYTETVIITKSLTLEGVGQPQPVVSGNDAGRPFTILGSVAVTMTNMTVTRGRAPVDPDGSARGGGIFNQGQLTLDHVIISYNQAIGLAGQAPEVEGGLAYGGGIYSECVPALADCFDVSLTAVTVISNTAKGGKGGVGAVGGYAYGGGVTQFCETNAGSIDCGSLTILDSRFGVNQAWGGQGGDSVTPFWSASGGQAFGGGISNTCIDYDCGAIELTRSEVHHNKARGGDSGDTGIGLPAAPADGFGGGIYTKQRPFIQASHIHHNQAHAGAYSPGPHGPYPDSIGGGVYMLASSGGPGGVENSAIDNNRADAGGGFFIANESLSIFNSTISENVARVCGAGILHASFEDSLFDYVTITENVVLDSPYSVGNSSFFCLPGGGSGIYRSRWAGSRFPSLKNSLLVNNWGYGDPHADCHGTILSRGFNYTTTCTLVGNLNGTISNPIMLGSLQDNGGLTPTHALLAGSLAIDAAAPADCPNTDQRQYPRWVDGNGDGIERCDMGAYEYGGAPTDVDMVGEIRGRVPFPLLFPSLLGLTACLVLWVWQKQKGT